MGARFEYAQAEEVRDAFARHGARYLFGSTGRRFALLAFREPVAFAPASRSLSVCR